VALASQDEPLPRLTTGAVESVDPGMLAINSDVPVNIYDGDTLVGSTPITLNVSPGTHTFEYRYENLVKTLSHVVRSNETTRVTVDFDIAVSINARPWAEVFIEGSPTSLGYTPLSDINLPAGTVLIFRNPGFPDKMYRVTATTRAIQVVFP
jgi:hypothetical protein